MIPELKNIELAGDTVTYAIETTLPGESGEAVTEAFREADQPSEATSRTAAILGIVIALWSASSGMARSARSLTKPVSDGASASSASRPCRARSEGRRWIDTSGCRSPRSS